MSGYLQRLFDGQAGLAPVRAAQMSSSPLVAVDQRLASPDFAANYGFTSSPDSFLNSDFSGDGQDFFSASPERSVRGTPDINATNPELQSRTPMKERVAALDQGFQRPVAPDQGMPSADKIKFGLNDTERSGFHFPSIHNPVAPVQTDAGPNQNADEAASSNQTRSRPSDGIDDAPSYPVDAKPVASQQNSPAIEAVDSQTGSAPSAFQQFPNSDPGEAANDVREGGISELLKQEKSPKQSPGHDDHNTAPLSRLRGRPDVSQARPKPEASPSTPAFEQAPVARPVPQPMPELAPLPQAEPDWAQIDRQIERTVEKRLEARDNSKKSRREKPAPVAEKVVTASNSNAATKPTTAEAASIIGPIETPSRHFMLFGRRMR